MTPPLIIEKSAVLASTYIKALSIKMLRQAWWALFLLAVLCVSVALVADARWALACLLLIMVATPMLLSLAYINYALSMEARWSLLEKRITIQDDGLLMQFSHPRMHDKLIAWNEIRRWDASCGCLLLELKVRQFTFLMIPFTSIEASQLTLRDVVSRVAQHISQAS
ncbi:MAG: hypothetical protein IJ808_09675 [Muribaculaceae bacterium]|nr:hypothetical protein [Muribaculaceae bacterium]